MEIKYGKDFFDEETDEELGAMHTPPVLGATPAPKSEKTKTILGELEDDIQRIGDANKRGAPIDKNLMRHFTRLKEKMVTSTKAEADEKKKGDNK